MAALVTADRAAATQVEEAREEAAGAEHLAEAAAGAEAPAVAEGEAVRMAAADTARSKQAEWRGLPVPEGRVLFSQERS